MEISKWWIFLFIISAPTFLNAQSTDDESWKTSRKEIFLGSGVTNLLGDIGGSNKAGTTFGPRDIDLNAIRVAGHLGYRYRLSSFLATSTTFQYVNLYGDDGLTQQPYRRYRNINIRTHLFELSQRLEFILWHSEETGARTKIFGLKNAGKRNNQFYAFTGANVFYYEPQGKGGKYGWTNLRYLNTEGQGLVDSLNRYSKYSWGIPIGIGFKTSIGNSWSIGTELTWTKTFTDYLDDTSGDYFDNEAIAYNFGQKAAFFADPSDGFFEDWTAAGKPRGNPGQKDNYIIWNFSLIYTITDGPLRQQKWKYKRRY